MAAEMTRDDLDKYIGDAVEKGVAKRFEGLQDTLAGLRKDLLGADKAEQITESQKKAATDFDAMSPQQRAAVLAGKGPAEKAQRPWEKSKETAGREFSRVLPLILRAKGNWRLAADYARAGGNADIADYIEKTLQAGDFDSGGALIPEAYASDFIEYLYAASVIRQIGARTIDLSQHGQITLGRLNQTATGYWVGEGDEITTSEETFGQLKLSLKKLGVFVPVSDDLIRFAAGDFLEIVRDDIAMVAALKEDLAMLRGDGSENQPKGILNWTAAGNKITTAGTTYANTITDLIKAQYKVEVANVPTPSPVWIMNPRALRGLTQMTDASGDHRPWFIEYSMNGTIEGAKPHTTTQLPKNLGGSSNATEIFYVEPSQLVIGEGMNVEIDESNVATYTASGAARNAFQRFEHVVRLGHEVDFAMRHNEAAAIITNSALGAALDA